MLKVVILRFHDCFTLVRIRLQASIILALAMLSQILTGLFLAMFYVSSSDLAFNSIEYIMRDVPFG
jgi:quinol-cytochrome oxidoreductase complex cytochrome b subunit